MLEGQQLTRRIQLGQGISSIGDGIWFTTWAIYLTQVLGFPAAVMGAAVGIGGLTGVGLAFPGGTGLTHEIAQVAQPGLA